MRIGLDLDGVVYNWDKTARYMLRTMRGYPKHDPRCGEDEEFDLVIKPRKGAYPEYPCSGCAPLAYPAKHWDYIKDNVKPEDEDWLWRDGVKLGLFRYGHLYSGAIEGVRELATIGDIVVITKRPKSAVQDTLDWLSYLKLPFAEIHMLHEPGAKKSAVK